MMIVLAILAFAIAGVLIAASQKPDTFSVSRSAVMNAAPDAIYPHVNDLVAWNAWSPWAKLDPNAKYTFTGPQSGPGAVVEWNGNGQVGAGRMTITDVTPPTRILINLEFFRPMKGVNDTLFTFEPQAQGTLVTWTMSGPNSTAGKIMSIFMNCEKMVGVQFEKGLATLKTLVEKK